MARRAAGLLVFGLHVGCLAVDEVQTPSADIERATGQSGEPDAVESGEEGDGDPADACGEGEWSVLRLGGRDQRAGWSAPVLALGCGAAPHRLTAAARGAGSGLAVHVSPSTGRVVEATYTTARVGADGEEWGEYQALIDVASVTFGASDSPVSTPFELSGTILGPFGPVPLELSGCARVAAPAC